MTIGTKYNIGDEVWYRKTNPTCVKIESIGVNIAKDGEVTVVYRVRNPKYIFLTTLDAEDIFPTKEELLKSL